MTPPTLRSRFLKPAVVAALALLALPAWAEVQTDQWSGQRALDIIVQLLKFTPRSMETVGHQQTIDYITAELPKTKFDTVTTQRWVERAGGRTMAMTNIIARFNPDNPRRMIVATHYDSIIRAYRDAKHPDAPMPGANNSASGVAAAAGNRARAVAAARCHAGRHRHDLLRRRGGRRSRWAPAIRISGRWARRISPSISPILSERQAGKADRLRHGLRPRFASAARAVLAPFRAGGGEEVLGHRREDSRRGPSSRAVALLDRGRPHHISSRSASRASW